MTPHSKVVPWMAGSSNYAFEHDLVRRSVARLASKGIISTTMRRRDQPSANRAIETTAILGRCFLSVWSRGSSGPDSQPCNAMRSTANKPMIVSVTHARRIANKAANFTEGTWT